MLVLIFLMIGLFNPLQPVTWKQSDALYTELSFPYGEEGSNYTISCGVHAGTALLLKSGYYKQGKTVLDFVEEMPEDFVEPRYDRVLKRLSPAYDYSQIEQMTDGFLTLTDVWDKRMESDPYEYIKSEAEKGQYLIVWLRGDTGGAHLNLVDYVEDKVYIIDSGTDRETLESVDQGWFSKYRHDLNGSSIERVLSFSSRGLKSYESPRLREGLTSDVYEESWKRYDKNNPIPKVKNKALIQERLIKE